ncbi:uncharacterized protein VTP21DRAFT_6266 [Calcarisporiella thermophila]|uniref:uncharacterized protein n=1 Tax=Calcarisporiella thermophila TaxID=911321 RepID=UPI0037440955
MEEEDPFQSQHSPPTWRVNLIGQEETIRLDTRVEEELIRRRDSREDTIASIYKIETVSTFTRDDDLETENVVCDAVASPGGFCLSVSKEIHLLNADCTEHQATINLDCEPERIAFNRDSSFLVVGDSLGTIHFIHVMSRTIVFSQEVFQRDMERESGRMFYSLTFASSPDSSETEELLVVLQNKLLYRFSNIQIKKLSEAVATQNAALGLEAKSSIAMERIDLGHTDSSPHQIAVNDILVVFESHSSCLITGGKGNASLCSWRREHPTEGEFFPRTYLETQIGRLLQGVGVVQIQVTRHGKLMVVLDESGSLSLWDRKSMIMLQRHTNTTISDFSIIPSANVDRLSSRRDLRFSIAVLTRPRQEDEETKRFVEVISLPDFKIQHKVPVLNNCWLVKRLKGLEDFTDTMYFVEGISDETSDSLSTLYVKALSEAVPLTRFQQLLRKGHYDAALLFSKQFGLDEQLVLKSRLSDTLANIASAGRDDKFNERVEMLMEDIAKIKDDAFIVDICLKAVLPSYSETSRLLSHARSIVQAANDRKSENSSISSLQVHSAIRRLGTYQLIRFALSEEGSAVPLSDSMEIIGERKEDVSYEGKDWEDACTIEAKMHDYFDGNAWQRFRTCDMVKVLRRLFGIGKPKLAIVAWRRHFLDADLMKHVREILTEIPASTSVEEFAPWLKNEVLPHVRKTEDRASVNEWIEQRARMMESRQRQPHDALEVIRLLDVNSMNEMANSATNGADEIQSTFNDLFAIATPSRYVDNTILLAQTASYSSFQTTTRDSGNVEKPTKLARQLEDLVYLWDAHDLKVTLAEYCQSSPSQIAIELVDRIAAPEVIPEAIEKNFAPYTEKNGLPHDELLMEYCIEVMDGAAKIGSTLFNAPWEARVLAILKYIRSFEIRLDVVIELMRRTPIPWSDDVEATIQDMLSQQGLRRDEELREQYRLMRLKRMLLKYSIRSFNVSDFSLAKGLVKYLVNRTDIDSAMEDALQVVGAYHHLSREDAYVWRLQSLCAAHKLSEALELLNQLDEKERENMPDTAIAPLTCCIGQEVIVWLLGVIEDVKESIEEDQYPPEAKATFSWAIDAALGIAEFFVSRTDSHTRKQLYVAAEKIEYLRSLKALFVEFGIVLMVDELAQVETCWQILRSEMEKMFSGVSYGTAPAGATNSFTKIYRLAEILNISRDSAKIIMAEEASAHGQFQTALILAKELQDKYPNNETGEVLRNIAFLMSRFAAQHPEMAYNTDQNAFRLTNQIQRISQNALTICSNESIKDCLDDFKCYEIQSDIFAQCEGGDYDALARTEGRNFEETPVVSSSSSTAGCFSAIGGLAGTTRQAFFENYSTLTDKYASSLFEDHYYENGLVMKTKDAMMLTGEFVISCCERGRAEPERNSSYRKAKSRASNHSSPFYVALKNLREYLRENRSFQTAVCVYHRAQEFIVRGNQELQLDSVDVNHYNELMSICIQKVLSARCIDQKLAFAYMISMDMEKAYEAFRAGMSTVGTDYHRLIEFAAIGIGCATIWKQRSFLVSCKELAAKGRWWHQLKLLSIPFDESHFITSKMGEYQRKLIPLFLERTNFDVLSALEFGQAYFIEDDFVFLEYIKQLFFSNCDNYQDLIAGVIDGVVNKGKLLKMLQELCLPRISPYDYERLLFLLKQMLHLDPENSVAKKGTIILDILKNYTRINPPSVEELSEAKKVVDGIDTSAYHIDPDKEAKNFPGCLRRLPYHLLIEEPWKVLKPELVESSIPRLVSLTVPLGLEADKFYVSVVDNLMTQMKSAQEKGHTPNFESVHSKPSFAEFKIPILRIQDTELAISVAKYVSDAFPCGVNKINALRTAINIAEKWHLKLSSEPDNERKKIKLERAATAMSKLREALARAETENQLRSLSLSDFVELVSQPLELICQLYARKSEQALIEADSIDLHSLANDISKRHNLEIDKIRQYLLTIWLTQELDISDKEKGMALPSMRIQLQKGSSSAQEISLQMRILYLLRCESIETSVRLLLKFAYQPSHKSSQKITTLARIRSIGVLLQLASPQEIGRVQKYSEVRTYMQMLLYLADFEELEIPLSLKEFINCNKDALARSLWVKHNQEPKVIQLICNLCLDNQIYDMTLWENTLARLLHFKMFKYLAGMLEHISSVPELAQLKQLPNIWNQTLLGFLQDIRDNEREGLSVPTIFSLPRIFLLIQKCPFLTELDLDTFANIFEEMLSHYGPHAVLKALAVLPPNALVGNRVREIVNGLTQTETLAVLEALFSHFVTLFSPKDEKSLAIPGLSLCNIAECEISKPFILTTVYDHIDAHSWYPMLVQHPQHLNGLIVHLIQHNQLDNMVRFTINAKRWRDLERLVAMYYKMRGSNGRKRRKLNQLDEERDEEREDDEDTEDLVEQFLRDRNLDLVVPPPLERESS